MTDLVFLKLSWSPSKYPEFKMAAQKRLEEGYNFLLLGETGVGKSTFINAFANYQKFPSMDDAMEAELLALIPSSFVVTDNNNETTMILVGQPGQSAVDGESDTQNCKAYLFESKGRIIRLIDTPGIGDTRGLDQDRINAQKILSFVGHYSVLHGIIILLKPNHARLDNSFRFCVMELLCYLHQNASDNIVFVFTNARGTSFKPGDTLTPLKLLLEEIKERNPAIDIPLTSKRTYCLDNEGFRSVAARKSGVEFSVEEIKDFSRSWQKSSESCNNLVDYIVQLKPHQVSESISVNDARRLIVGFSRPLGDITYQIQINLTLVQEQENKIDLAGEDHIKLKSELVVPSIKILTTNIDQPITVCAAEGCLEVYQSNGIPQLHYAQKCHNPCYLLDVTPNIIKNEDLLDCAAMNGTQQCEKCGCSWEKHMHIYYETEIILEDTLSDALGSNQFETKDEIIARSKKVLNELDDQREQLELEQETITRVSAKFAHFLKQTAIAPYNDAVEDYIQHLIDGEQAKSNQQATGAQVLTKLEKMKKAYKAEKDVLEETLASSEYTDSAITPIEITNYCQELFALKLNGPIIQAMVNEFEEASKKEHDNFTEVIFY